MQDDNRQESAATRQPLIDTGRAPLHLTKHPTDLDFAKKVGGTTYVVKSHFKSDAEECLLAKVSRLFHEGKNLSEY